MFLKEDSDIEKKKVGGGGGRLLKIKSTVNTNDVVAGIGPLILFSEIIFLADMEKG